MSNNIIIVGFMAVGKGRTARKLSRKTGLYTVDTDDLIEALVKKRIDTIFKKKGQAYFRSLEQDTANWLENNVSKTVVSTGGGFFKVKNIKRIGRVVYLHSSFDAIIDKLTHSSNSKKRIAKRPLLSHMKQARALYKERLPQYREIADLEVCVTGKRRSSIAKEIIKKLDISL